MKRILQNGATLKLTVQTSSSIERTKGADDDSSEFGVTTLHGISANANEKHGWIVIEPRALRANALALKAAGIDVRTVRGKKMVGEWTALAAAKYRLGKSREVPELRAFAFVRDCSIGSGDDRNLREGAYDGVQLELFDDDDDDDDNESDNDDDEEDVGIVNRRRRSKYNNNENSAIDESEREDVDEDILFTTETLEERRASTSESDDDDDEDTEYPSSENNKTRNSKPFALRVRLASKGTPVTFRLPNVLENVIFDVSSSFNGEETNRSRKKKIGMRGDDSVTFKFWANPASLATALAHPNAMLKVQTSSYSSSSLIPMSRLLETPTVRESTTLDIASEGGRGSKQQKVNLELTLSDLSIHRATALKNDDYFENLDEEIENFEPAPRPPLKSVRPKPTDFHDRIRRTRANILQQKQQQQQKQHPQQTAPNLFSSEAEVRNSAEYNTAYALENWKRERMLAWESKFTEEATKRMQSLEEAWKQREIQRNAEFENSTKRAKEAEHKLKELTRMLESREREVIRAEETIERRKKELERAHTSKHEQLKREYASKEETLEKKVENALRDQKASKKERDDAAKKAAKLEKQKREIEDMFSEYKKNYFQSDVAKLNSEIATLRPRLESAENALEDASSSRDRFRVQMRKMAAQIVALEREKAQLRDALEKTGGKFPNRAHVAPDSSHILDLSLREDFSYTNNNDETAYKMSNANMHLSALLASKAERRFQPTATKIKKGKEDDEEKYDEHERRTHLNHHHHPMSMSEKRMLEKEVRRLVAERGDLMSTGAYSTADRAISLIDERIEELTLQISA